MAMADETKSSETNRSRPLLRRTDQACAAVVVFVSLTAILGSWIYHGGRRGRLIDIDRAEPQSVRFQLDMNQADWPEWALLPGIGETLAQRIVESRSKDGPFVDHEDLLRVRGIGPKTLENIRPYLLPVADADSMAGP